MGVLILGSRYNVRMAGSEKSTSAETRDFRARAALTVAKDQCRTRDVYCGKRTWTFIAKPLTRKTSTTVRVGFGVRKSVKRER